MSDRCPAALRGAHALPPALQPAPRPVRRSAPGLALLLTALILSAVAARPARAAPPTVTPTVTPGVAAAPVTSAAPAHRPPVVEPAFAAARQLFLQADGGDTGRIAPAAEAFARLADARPDDPVLQAYAGAAEARLASTTWLPWRKLRHAEDGLARIDRALARLPAVDDQPGPSGLPAGLETRFVAAATFLALPAMFNRQPRGAALLAQVQADPRLAAAPEPFRQAVAQRAAALAGAGPAAGVVR